MRKLLLLIPAVLLTLFFVTACPKPGCIIEDKLVDVASNVIVEKLQCANKAAVKEDVTALIKNLGLCKATQTGPIADVVCPPMVKAVVDKLMAAAVPFSWQCSAESAKVTLITELTNACKKIPVDN